MPIRIVRKNRRIETNLRNAILDYLSAYRVPHTVVTTTGAIIHRGGRTFFGRTKQRKKGAADIVGCYRGVPFAIEVKAPSGNLRPDQAEWLRAWQNDGGGVARVVFCMDEVETMFGEINNFANKRDGV